MFARTTSVRFLVLLLALVLAAASADARANVAPRKEPDVRLDRYWEEMDEPGSDLLFYRPLMAGQKGERKLSCPQPNEARSLPDPR